MTYLVGPAEGSFVQGLPIAAIEENAPSGLLVGAVVSPHQNPDNPIVHVEIAEVYKWFDENAGHWTVEEENRPSEHFTTDGALVYTAKPFDFEMMNYDDGRHASSVTLSLTLTDSAGVVTVITQDLPVIDLDETVHGGRGNDVLIGTETMNFIYGGAGNDVIEGKSQDDKLYGESGNDRLYGGAGIDILDGGAGNDLLDGGTARSSVRYDGTVTHEANRLTGGAGKDRLVDHGDDIFVYTSIRDSLPSARDVIVNWQGKPWIDFYENWSDKLIAGSVFDLSAIDANTRKAGDQAFRFIGTKDFTGKAGELRYAMAKSHTEIYADVNGDRKADFAISIDAHTKLTADFFIL